MISKIFTQLKKRKFTAGIAFLLIVGIGYWGFGKFFSEDDVVRYVTAQVQKGMLIASITGTGNVIALEMAEVKPRISGTISTVKISLGDKVGKEQVLATITNDDLVVKIAEALVNLNQAKENVEKAKLDKLQQEANLVDLQQKNDDDPDSVTDLEIKQAEQKVRASNLAIKSAEVKVKTAELDYRQVKTDAEQRTVKSPIAGTVTMLNAKVGDEVGSSETTTPSSGNQDDGKALATVMALDKLGAEISLNEVDIARMKKDAKATLTFDAVKDLTLTGTVTAIDVVGTVEQGVVSYKVKINFDAGDDRVKPGITVSAAIVTEAKPDVLIVSNSAVKSQGGMSYVEVPDESDMSVATANVSGAVFQNPTRQQQIEVGTANDEFTEILSGLKEGDLVVTRTIQPTAATQTQTQQQSGGLRIPGLNTGGGGARTGGGFQR